MLAPMYGEEQTVGVKPRLNKEWHQAHVLGQHASLDDRSAWHLEHAKNCGCREMPESIRAEIERRGLTPRE